MTHRPARPYARVTQEFGLRHLLIKLHHAVYMYFSINSNRIMELAQSIGLQPFLERDADGNPLLEEDESLLSKFERLQLILGSDADQGEGTLCITPSRIIWLSETDASKGFTVDFTAISMHAVMTDAETVEKPCLYVQLDLDEDIEYDGAGGDSDSEAESPLPELRLVPSSPSALDDVFKAFCDGAARNPDFDAEEEGDGELFYDEAEVLAGAADAAIHLNNVDGVEEADLDRFEDPEEEDEEEEEEGVQDAHAAPPS